MANLVGDHIGARKLAGLAAAAAEAHLEIAEERGVEINLAIVRAIERSHGALRRAASRTRHAGENHQPRRTIGLAFLLENVLPLHLGAAEHACDKAPGVVARRAGAALRLARHLLLLLRSAGEDFGAADQEPRVDAERIADDAQNDDGADAEATTADRHAAAAETSAAVAAAIIDIPAFRQIIQAHCHSPSPNPAIVAGQHVEVQSTRLPALDNAHRGNRFHMVCKGLLGKSQVAASTECLPWTGIIQACRL